MALTIAPTEIINHRFRRGGSGKKDRLDKDAARAAELGMSYGQYKAAEREGGLPAGALPDLEEEIETPEPEPEVRTGKGANFHKNVPRKTCVVCGQDFQPLAINGRYCGATCRNKGKRKNSAAYRERHRAEVRA